MNADPDYDNPTTELPCYLCYLNETGLADMTPDSNLSPIRTIIKEITVNAADPTAAYKLSCGHTVI